MSKSPRSPVLHGAGMASSYYSISIIKGQMAQQFRKEQDKKKINFGLLSPRIRAQIQGGLKKYEVWLNEWEKSAQFNRFLMLNKFIREAQGFTVADLDNMFGNATELVFCHIFSFFKVNCKNFCSISLQLKAMRIFFEAISGQKFCDQFIKAQGHSLIANLLQSKLIEMEDRIQIIQTLLSISLSIQNRKAMVEEKIVNTIIESLPIVDDKEYHELSVKFITKIGDGSPELCDQIMNTILPYFIVFQENERSMMTLARSYRVLMLPELSESLDIKNHLYEIIVLTRSPNHEIQGDGILIFSHLMNYETTARRDFLLHALSDLLTFSKEDVSEEDAGSLGYQQSFVLRLFVDIFAQKSPAATSLCKMITSLLPNLVAILGDTASFTNQMFAAQCISKMCEFSPEAKMYLSNAIPQSWADEIIKDPRKFCIAMTQTQSDTLKSLERSQFLMRHNNSINFSGYFPKSKVRSPHSARTKTTLIERESPLTFNPKIINASDVF